MPPGRGALLRRESGKGGGDVPAQPHVPCRGHRNKRMAGPGPSGCYAPCRARHHSIQAEGDLCERLLYLYSSVVTSFAAHAERLTFDQARGPPMRNSSSLRAGFMRRSAGAPSPPRSSAKRAEGLDKHVDELLAGPGERQGRPLSTALLPTSSPRDDKDIDFARRYFGPPSRCLPGPYALPKKPAITTANRWPKAIRLAYVPTRGKHVLSRL